MISNEAISSYVLCIDDGGYPESLEVRKIYPALPNEKAASRDYVRIIDETGEDYLYPMKYFVALNLPPEVIAALPDQTSAINR
jgi:hypothetical protein